MHGQKNIKLCNWISSQDVSVLLVGPSFPFPWFCYIRSAITYAEDMVKEPLTFSNFTNFPPKPK